MWSSRVCLPPPTGNYFSIFLYFVFVLLVEMFAHVFLRKETKETYKAKRPLRGSSKRTAIEMTHMFEQCLNMFVKEDADGFCMSWYHPIFCHINPPHRRSPALFALPSFRSFDGKVNDSFDLHKELSLLFQSAARESCGSYLSIVPGWCVEGAICVLFIFIMFWQFGNIEVNLLSWMSWITHQHSQQK